jgi:hypothetical protein
MLLIKISSQPSLSPDVYRVRQKPNTSGIQFHPGGGEFCTGSGI